VGYDVSIGQSSWLVPVAALLVATFAVVTNELIPTGLLPAIAADLAVDIPTAGLLITGYAIGVAIAGPVLALLTSRVPRKLLLLAIMAVLVVASILSATASSYWLLLGGRVLIAAGHGLFFGVTMVLASRLAPPGRQATALSLVMAGVNAATILGVPLGTAIGNAVGWRMTFWVIVGVAVVAAVVLSVLIPGEEKADTPRPLASFRAEAAAALRPVVLICYTNIALSLVAFFVMVTYMVPYLTEVGGVPIEAVPLVLVAIGVAGFFGNLLGGRLGDWNPVATMFGALAINTVLFAVRVIWLVGFAFPAPVQSRILREVSDAPNFASTLISTAFQVGIAAGAALGGSAIAMGWGYARLPLLSALFMGFALVGTLVLFAFERRRKPLPA
jgi:DHA1 family inner membrane transport protein